MAMNLKPLGDRVVIKPSPKEEVTKSGLVIPDTAKEKPQEGMVLAIGPGKLDEDGKRLPMDVKVGDKVLYAKYAGTEIKLEGEEHLIVKESDILAIVGYSLDGPRARTIGSFPSVGPPKQKTGGPIQLAGPHFQKEITHGKATRLR
jgi:chaperonin GroES